MRYLAILILAFTGMAAGLTDEEMFAGFRPVVDEYYKAGLAVDYPVVFVHGIAAGLEKWQRMACLFSDSNYFIMHYYNNDLVIPDFIGREPKRWFWVVSYYTPDAWGESLNGNLTKYTLRLEKIINRIKQISFSDKVVIIAHSMGGLIARNYMVRGDSQWNSVYRLLTVGTPNQGISLYPGLTGQLADLKSGSIFISNLDQKWDTFYSEADKKWGVIGGIDDLIWNSPYDNPASTDTGGPGFIEIQSAIPFGEWKEAAGTNMDRAFMNTGRFGFRLAVRGNHESILFLPGTVYGVLWAISKSPLEAFH